MPAGFVRRYNTDPGLDELTAIEGVVIIDRDPPESILGAGVGTVICVGETENGPFAVDAPPNGGPREVFSSQDFSSTWGGFGYVVGGVTSKNPCARVRQADGALLSESWNGNLFVHLRGKRFKRLILARPDTSVGKVRFTRRANLLGYNQFRFALTSGQHLDFKINGAGAVVATFTGVTATVTGVAGTFNPGIGATATLGWDAESNFTVIFDGSETTNALCISRINQYAGFTFADLSGGQIRLTGRIPGTSGQVRVVSGSTGTLAALGHSVATTVGTGNVGNINAVTPAEINTRVQATSANAFVDQLSDGTLRMYSILGHLEVVVATTATAFGFPVAVSDEAAGNAGTIPAGTIVRMANSAQIFVTMQDVAVLATSAGPYEVRVRHATDDLTGGATTPGQIDTVDATTPIDLDAFSVSNVQATSIALTDTQIDTAYLAAIDATLSATNVAKEGTLIVAARQSNAVRRKLRENALSATKKGLRARRSIVRPPLNTTVATAVSSVSEPGVGAYRAERVPYAYPGFAVQVPEIARLGLAGGSGFTVDGIVDVGSDIFLASVISQLNPEENPGQLTDFLGAVVSLERGSNIQGFDIDTYRALKAAGICAPRIDEGSVFFQSGVTSVSPATFPALAPINRRGMADYIQDSLAFGPLMQHTKRLMTRARRRAIVTAIREFLRQLLSPENDDLQRIAAFATDERKGNTSTSIKAGIFRVRIAVTLVPSLDVLVLDTVVGQTVDVNILNEAA